MANYAQTVNVIGAIKTTKTQAEFETTGLVLKLYRERFGEIPVQVKGDFSPLDIVAALSSDRTTLTVAVVNPTDKEQALSLKLNGARLTGGAQTWTITGADKWAHNAPGQARQVDIVTSHVLEGMDRIKAAPLSVTLCACSLR